MVNGKSRPSSRMIQTFRSFIHHGSLIQDLAVQNLICRCVLTLVKPFEIMPHCQVMMNSTGSINHGLKNIRKKTKEKDMSRKSMLLLVAFVISLGLAAGCGKTVIIQQGPEVFLPGEYVESVDAMIDLVKCRGKGIDKDAAMLNARKGCLEWMIVEKLAQARGERQAYRANQKQIMANLDRYVPVPKVGSRAGNGEGVKSVTQNADGSVNITIITKVFKKQLMNDLVDMNIIASKDDMLESVGLPSIVALPSKAVKGKKYRKIMEDLVNSYLTKEKWEVIDISAVTDLQKMVQSISEVADADEDEIGNIASAVGADVYLVFEANPDKKGEGVAWEVGISAYETTTGRKLASEAAVGGARYKDMAGQERTAMMEALQKAMGKVIPQITDYWKDDAPKGRRFRVFFIDAPKNTDMKMNPVLKRTCSRVKLIKSSPKGAEFMVQCKMDNLELAGAIDEGIGAKMGGAEHEFVAKNRNTIIVQFK